MGFNPRILIFHRGEAPVKYQNSGVFPSWLSSYKIQLYIMKERESGIKENFSIRIDVEENRVLCVF